MDCLQGQEQRRDGEMRPRSHLQIQSLGALIRALILATEA